MTVHDPRGASQLLQAALTAERLLVCLAGPYGNDLHYGAEFVPLRMRDLYPRVPTAPVESIVEWKSVEIERSRFHRCVWRIATPKNLVEPVPVGGMKYARRTISSPHSIRAAAIAQGMLHVVMVEGGAAPAGAPPNARWLCDLDGRRHEIDADVEATEPGSSIILSTLQLIPRASPGYSLDLNAYAIWDPLSAGLPLLAVRFGQTSSISLVRRADTSTDQCRARGSYTRRIVAVGILGSPFVGTATRD